jgi:tetratricopeptide (TPR) repeat protein
MRRARIGYRYTKMLKKFLSCVILTSIIAGPVSFSYPQSRKPVLIRDTDKADGKEEADEPKPKEHSPLLAEKSYNVGNFYFKKKNYQGAIERYLEALEYQPELKKALEALDRAFAKAIEEDKDYIRKNPEAPDLTDRREKLTKLEKQQADLKSRRPESQ